MSRKQFQSKKPLAIAIGLLLSTLLSAPAQAQYSPFNSYSPLTGGTNLFWPLRTLLSPGSMLFRGGYGYNAPYYLANTLTYNAAYAAGQGVNTVGRQNYINNYWNPANGMNAPVVDQVSVAPWYYPPRMPVGTPIVGAGNTSPATAVAGVSAQQAGEFPVPSNSKGSEFMPVPSAAAVGDSSNLSPMLAPALASAKADSLDPAPDFRKAQDISGKAGAKSSSANSKRSANSDALGKNDTSATPGTTASQASETNPFAQAFIDHVNNKFGGDISKALSDKQTRGYAQALGILEHGPRDYDIPADRIELIKRIMQDPEENSLSKVNTIRMLIKH